MAQQPCATSGTPLRTPFNSFMYYYNRAAGRGQGLTLVHFSAQLERFLWDRGCA
jgi:hypothetical protein